MNRVSVVIPAYNYGRYIAEAIDSALAQTLPPLEVIVVDDGSTDGTAEVLARYGDRIRVVRQKNQGVAAARNRGISVARGATIAFLDADDIWKPRKLELQMARFDADPSLGLVSCGLESFDASGRTLETRVQQSEGQLASALLRFEPDIIAAASTIVVPKRIAEEIGGFDVRLPPSEDWDFCYRIATRYPVGQVAAALVRYRLHDSGIHLNIARMESSMLLAFEKAFASGDPAVQALRREAYGRLHRILAGSYFQNRQLGSFVRNALLSLRYDPGSLRYFAAYPLRLIRRLRATTAA